MNHPDKALLIFYQKFAEEFAIIIPLRKKVVAIEEQRKNWGTIYASWMARDTIRIIKLKNVVRSKYCKTR